MPKIIQTLLLPAICLLPAISSAQMEQVRLSKDSKLSINGTSNVRDFQCRSQHELQKDTLRFSYDAALHNIQLDGLSLSLEVDQFDCGKRGINRDFRSTLKAKEHPFITLTLLELIMNEEQDTVPEAARIRITIAEQDQEYQVAVREYTETDSTFTVTGSKSLKMTDFELKPPTAMFGLIKVNDELTIDFNLVIRK